MGKANIQHTTTENRSSKCKTSEHEKTTEKKFKMAKKEKHEKKKRKNNIIVYVCAIKLLNTAAKYANKIYDTFDTEFSITAKQDENETVTETERTKNL